MEENLKFDTASVQAMKRGRLPLIPSLDPKNVINRSCTSLLALVTGLHNQSMSFQDNTPSLYALMPAVSFWLCLFFEYIILPSRAPEFKCVDFHHAVLHILAWTTKPNTLGIIEPRLLRDYLPFLWFHPPLGCPKYNLEDSWSIFAAVYIVILYQNGRTSSYAGWRKIAQSPLILSSNSLWTSSLISRRSLTQVLYINLS
ncbi:hypothetical protein EDD85DRAFT_861117 [Armillaria nabsnona]|nr:hypothetical protein EDD85DRAFT_861117 [Armillaria nabsnona]